MQLIPAVIHTASLRDGEIPSPGEWSSPVSGVLSRLGAVASYQEGRYQIPVLVRDIPSLFTTLIGDRNLFAGKDPRMIEDRIHRAQ